MLALVLQLTIFHVHIYTYILLILFQIYWSCDCLLTITACLKLKTMFFVFLLQMNTYFKQTTHESFVFYRPKFPNEEHHCQLENVNICLLLILIQTHLIWWLNAKTKAGALETLRNGTHLNEASNLHAVYSFILSSKMKMVIKYEIYIY